MTMKELSQLHWLNVEIDRDKQRLAELEARAASPGGPNMSGMPGGGGAGSNVEIAALEIVELKASIEAKIIRCATERARLIGYIDAVPDSRMREIMYLRFVDGLPWDWARVWGTRAMACARLASAILTRARPKITKTADKSEFFNKLSVFVRRVGCILIAIIIILHCGFRARELWVLPRSCFPRCHLHAPPRE